MTAADETPAQPDNESIWTMAYELARDAQAAGLVVVILRPTTCRHGVEFDVSLWCPDGRLWAEGRGESAEMIREQHIAGFVRYLADAQPDVAPAPDGNAGGADVYREAAWAWANYEGPMGLPDEQRKDLLRLQVEFKARQPNHRAVVDVARSPLLAEIETLRGHILDIDAHATPYGDIPDDPGWVGTYLVTAGALHRALGKIGHSAPKCQAEAQLAEAIRERDAARAIVEDLLDLLRDVWSHGAVPQSISDEIMKWLGPVEICPAPPAPDSNAGEAGAEVYRDAARVYIASGTGQRRGYGDWLIPDLIEDAAWRDTIDAGRAPLLAELAEVRGEMAAASSYLDMAEVEVDKIVAQRDQARTELAEAILERDGARATLAEANEALGIERQRNTSAELTEAREYGTEMLNEREKALAKLAEVDADRDAYRRERNAYWRERDETRATVEDLLALLRRVPTYGMVPTSVRDDIAERLGPGVRDDEARAGTDGGEWKTIRGWIIDGEFQSWLSYVTHKPCAPTHERRTWTGPVEPVTDDGGATDA